MDLTNIFIKFVEIIFRYESNHQESSSMPVKINIVGPLDTEPYASPSNAPAGTPSSEIPFQKDPAKTPVYKEPPVTPPTTESIDRKTTARPFHRTTQWEQQWDHQTPSHQESTNIPTVGDRWNFKPSEKEHKLQENVSASNGSSSNLENFLWVVLGGIVVLTLIAIFMKIGKPIRRARRQRQRLNAQSAVAAITRRQDPDDRYLDMGSLLRLTDTDTEPLCDDLPPPYSVCMPNTNKRDTEEPPPRFSACFVTYTNTKGTEPKVHIPQQKVVFKNGLRDVSIAMDESEDVGDTRTELILVNGRIFEKPKFHENGNNETILTSNDNVAERRTRRTDQKGRVVRINTNDTVRIY